VAEQKSSIFPSFLQDFKKKVVEPVTDFFDPKETNLKNNQPIPITKEQIEQYKKENQPYFSTYTETSQDKVRNFVTDVLNKRFSVPFGTAATASRFIVGDYRAPLSQGGIGALDFTPAGVYFTGERAVGELDELQKRLEAGDPTASMTDSFMPVLDVGLSAAEAFPLTKSGINFVAGVVEKNKSKLLPRQMPKSVENFLNMGVFGVVPTGDNKSFELGALSNLTPDNYFFSPLQESSKFLVRKKGSGQAFLNELKKISNKQGFPLKDSEIKATGLLDFLNSKPEFTQQEVLDFIGKNNFEIQATDLIPSGNQPTEKLDFDSFGSSSEESLEDVQEMINQNPLNINALQRLFFDNENGFNNLATPSTFKFESINNYADQMPLKNQPTINKDLRMVYGLDPEFNEFYKDFVNYESEFNDSPTSLNDRSRRARNENFLSETSYKYEKFFDGVALPNFKSKQAEEIIYPLNRFNESYANSDGAVVNTSGKFFRWLGNNDTFIPRSSDDIIPENITGLVLKVEKLKRFFPDEFKDLAKDGTFTKKDYDKIRSYHIVNWDKYRGLKEDSKLNLNEFGDYDGAGDPSPQDLNSIKTLLIGDIYNFFPTQSGNAVNLPTIRGTRNAVRMSPLLLSDSTYSALKNYIVKADSIGLKSDILSKVQYLSEYDTSDNWAKLYNNNKSTIETDPLSINYLAAKLGREKDDNYPKNVFDSRRRFNYANNTGDAELFNEIYKINYFEKFGADKFKKVFPRYINDESFMYENLTDINLSKNRASDDLNNLILLNGGDEEVFNKTIDQYQELLKLRANALQNYQKDVKNMSDRVNPKDLTPNDYQLLTDGAIQRSIKDNQGNTHNFITRGKWDENNASPKILWDKGKGGKEGYVDITNIEELKGYLGEDRVPPNWIMADGVRSAFKKSSDNESSLQIVNGLKSLGLIGDERAKKLKVGNVPAKYITYQSVGGGNKREFVLDSKKLYEVATPLTWNSANKHILESSVDNEQQLFMAKPAVANFFKKADSIIQRRNHYRTADTYFKKGMPFGNLLLSDRGVVDARELGNFYDKDYSNPDEYANSFFNIKNEDYDKVLYVDELQSDVPVIISEIEKQAEDFIKKVFEDPNDPGANYIKKYVNDLKNAFPYEKDYHEILLKNAIMKAINEGYDYVAIPRASMLMDKWGDDYQIFYKNLYNQKIPKFLEKVSKKYDGETGQFGISGLYRKTYTEQDEDGDVFYNDGLTGMKPFNLHAWNEADGYFNRESYERPFSLKEQTENHLNDVAPTKMVFDNENFKNLTVEQMADLPDMDQMFFNVSDRETHSVSGDGDVTDFAFIKYDKKNNPNGIIPFVNYIKITPEMKKKFGQQPTIGALGGIK
jgi:hypothetical protein